MVSGMKRTRALLQWPALIISAGVFWAVMYRYWKSGNPEMMKQAKLYSTVGLVAMIIIGLLGLSKMGMDRDDEPAENTGRLKVVGIDKATQESAIIFVNARFEADAKMEAERQGLIVLSVSKA